MAALNPHPEVAAMQLRMAENSLFAVLLRSPWWYAALVAAGIVVAAHALLPGEYAWVGASGALPFIVVAAVAGWRQRHRPGERQVQATREALLAMGRDRLVAVLAQAYERQGYAVERLQDPAADLVLTRAGRTSLLACRRWKAARTGAEPLRELAARRDAREAEGCFYVTLNDLTEQAAAVAASEGVTVLRAPELATLLKGLDLRP